jgi:hypothetical protein
LYDVQLEQNVEKLVNPEAVRGGNKKHKGKKTHTTTTTEASVTETTAEEAAAVNDLDEVPEIQIGQAGVKGWWDIVNGISSASLDTVIDAINNLNSNFGKRCKQ